MFGSFCLISKVAIFCESEKFLERARQLSGLIQAPLFRKIPDKSFLFYLVVEDFLSLQLNEENAPSPLRIDFASGAINFRRRYGQSGGELLIKAIGGGNKKVLDATAGLGRDAFILSQHGCQVKAFEKSTIIGVLLEDALIRGSKDPKIQNLCGRIDLSVGDSREYLKNLSEEIYDTTYIDPMFPEKKKDALPKKEMRILQQLLPNTSDETLEEFIELALLKCRRVVVKRPAKGETALSLKVKKPNHAFQGKAIRFDVYLR